MCTLGGPCGREQVDHRVTHPQELCRSGDSCSGGAPAIQSVAADLLNEAVCITWEKWQENKIEQPEQIAGYIFQVALNLLRNRRRAMGERPGARADNARLDALADDTDGDGHLG